MRKIKTAAVVIVLGVCMAAAGCGGKNRSDTQTDGIADSGADDAGGAGEAGGAAEVLTLRIVDGAETGTLILAGEQAGDVYTLSVGETPIFLDGEAADAGVLEDGMMAEIRYTGGVEDSFPGQLCGVESVFVFRRGTQRNPYGTYYDICGLYLQVLEDLWDVDSGLNDGAVYVSVDLSEAPGDLTMGEKEAIAWIFACAHQAEPLTLTYEELNEQGYLTSEAMGEEDGGRQWREWTDGVLFSVEGTGEETEMYSLPVLKFRAQKWRTPLGAYIFEDCGAVWSESGTWGGSYTVGTHAIS